MEDMICSTTRSVSTNRASHAAKVTASGTLFAFALHRFAIPRKFLAAGLMGSNLSFSAIWLTHAAISLVHKKHSPDPYNRVLNAIWGVPQSKRARVQFPLATGLEVAALSLLLRGPRNWSLVLGGVGGVGLMVRAHTLWGVLSTPPGGSPVQAWAHPPKPPPQPQGGQQTAHGATAMAI